MALYLTLALAFFIALAIQAGRVLITLYALKLGAQPLTIGVLAALYSVLPTVLSWHAGRLSDRYGSRWVVTAGAGAGLCGMLIPSLAPGLPALYLAALLNGLLLGVSSSPLQNLVGLLSRDQKDRARNFSNFSLMVSFTGFLGPLLAGPSLDRLGPGPACLLMALLAMIPFALLLLRGGILPGATRTTHHAGSVRDLLAESGLWRVLATSSLVIAGIDLFQIYLPIHGNRVGLSATGIGVVLAMYSLAAFIVRVFLPQLVERYGAERLLAWSFLIGGAGFLMMPLFAGTVMLSVVSFLFGVGMGCGQPITVMLTYSGSAQGRSGEAMGIRIAVNHLTRVVVPVVFGSIGSALGLSPVFWISALTMASGSLFSRSQAGGSRPKTP
jgi:MFS family permease